MATTIEILMQDACDPSLMLRWKNLLGGWDYWLFEWSQDSKLNVSKGSQYRVNVSDLLTATEVFQYYKKEGRNNLTLYAENLTANQVETIRKIALSPKVEVLEEVGVSPLIWVTVLVDQTEIGLYKTENNNHSISVGIREVEIQTLSN